MIQLISRIRYPELYGKMMSSAKANANGLVMFTSMLDDGQPKLAESYNLLGATSMADILLFVHDDVIFLSKGWDDKIKDAFALGFNVAGVVGSKEYQGGMIFDAGKKHSAGKIVGVAGDQRMVKLMQHRAEIEPVKVVDGVFLAVTREHFLSNGFDYQFDGLFFYDIDLCLRSNCAVVDILISHEKPDHLRGQYPKDMRPMSDYEPMFNAKHGFKANAPIGDQHCDSMLYSDYVGVPA